MPAFSSTSYEKHPFVTAVSRDLTSSGRKEEGAGISVTRDGAMQRF